MKILIFGAGGYLGSNCVKSFKNIKVVPDITTNVAKFDQVLYSVKKHRPDWILNCSAKTNEDKAETDIEYWKEMIEANLLGAINILKVAHINNIKLCHIRTQFEVIPIDDYSLSKISAYGFISAEKYKDTVLSITPGWFFGGINSTQFDSLLIKSIKEKFPLGITNNSVCTPVYMPDFVEELEKFILNDKRGHFILSGTESCTRYEFAECLAKNLDKNMSDLNWVENNNFPEVVKRPNDWRVMGYLRTYKESIKDFIDSTLCREL